MSYHSFPKLICSSIRKIKFSGRSNSSMRSSRNSILSDYFWYTLLLLFTILLYLPRNALFYTMPQSYKLLIKLFIAFSLLSIGGLIYYSFRTKELLMFDWANSLGLSKYIDSIRANLSHIQIPIFIKYCLPNALWCTSYIIATDTIISIDNNRFEWTISLPIVAAILEVLQAFYLIPGTFDIMDLCCFLIPTVIYIVYYKSRY